jgi:hypothetical protein
MEIKQNKNKNFTSLISIFLFFILVSGILPTSSNIIGFGYMIQPVLTILFLTALFFLIGIYSENRFIVSMVSFIFVMLGIFVMTKGIDEISIDVANILGIFCIFVGCYSIFTIALEYMNIDIF